MIVTAMEQPPKKIFVLWDLSNSEVRITLQALARKPPEGISLSFADPEKVNGGDLLADILVPGIQAADIVLVVAPPAHAFVPVAFELGIAISLGKPIAWASTEQPEYPAVPSLLAGIFPGAAQKWAMDLRRFREYHFDDWEPAQIPLPLDLVEPGTLAICPRHGMGQALRELVAELQPDWNSLEPGKEMPRHALSARRVLWVITPSELPANGLGALAAGLFYGRACSLSDEPLAFEVLRHRDVPPIRSVARFSREFSDLDDFVALLKHEDTAATLAVEKIEIQNFKNIGRLTLDLTAESSLEGDWTCIAGINGAGKSSILQALAMSLLGERLVTELGGERIRRFLRRSGTQRLSAEITVTVRDGPELKTLYLPLSEQGVDFAKLNAHPERSRMIDVWDRLQKQVIVGYGASRNLSEYRDTRYASLSVPVQRQMTLFDSLTQIASVDVLLEGGPSSEPVLKTLKRLLKAVLVEELAPGHNADRIVFSQCGTEVDAIDLPDGFRSTVAWLADLCAAWHRTAPPEETAMSDPARITGIALVDEIDLHLHATLQRALVPRLRAALPNVQFIVTTHSPLVLSSFDRAEIVVLDRDEETGIRELDRQIFAFSTDQVYELLMGTPPQSTVIEEKLEKGDDPDLALYLYQSRERSEEEARAELAERRRLIEELRGAASK
jgi:predicted ATPase